MLYKCDQLAIGQPGDNLIDIRIIYMQYRNDRCQIRSQSIYQQLGAWSTKRAPFYTSNQPLTAPESLGRKQPGWPGCWPEIGDCLSRH